MKKVNGKFVLMQIAAVILVGFLASVISGIFDGGIAQIDVIIVLGVIFSIMLGVFYASLSSLFTKRLVKKTIQQNAANHNFENCSTFNGSGATILIDQRTGRIAYVANQNPFEFQVISAKDIERINSDYVKGALGGTNYVYFEFYYNKKRVRIPTFISRRQMYSLKSAVVLEGISKADAYAEILRNAKNAAA